MFSQDINWENLSSNYHLTQDQLNEISNQKNCLLQLSAGPDSVAVLKLILTIHRQAHINNVTPTSDRKLILLYIDHYNKENKTRENLLSSLASLAKKESNLLVDMIIIRRDISRISKKLKQNFEKTASRLRQKITLRIARQHNIKTIFTGHNLSDWFETLIMRINRGTSIEALTPLNFLQQRQNFLWLRPLYLITKDEILTLLQEAKIEYWHDPENDNLKFSRNKIRFAKLSLNPSGLRISARNLLKNFREQEQKFFTISQKLITIKENFEYRISVKTLANLPLQDLIDIKMFILKYYLGMEYFSKMSRDNLAKESFKHKFYFIERENWNDTLYYTFRKARLNLPKSNLKGSFLLGNLVTKKYKVAHHYGHKSIKKIFSEKKISNRQISNTICILDDTKKYLIKKIIYPTSF